MSFEEVFHSVGYTLTQHELFVCAAALLEGLACKEINPAQTRVVRSSWRGHYFPTTLRESQNPIAETNALNFIISQPGGIEERGGTDAKENGITRLWIITATAKA
jgi:hypothetical protein